MLVLNWYRLILLTLKVFGVIAYQEQNLPRSVLSLHELPEPFQNSKLPAADKEIDKCFHLIGCFEKFPNKLTPEDPEGSKTEFKISNEFGETVVAFEPTVNCLPNSETCDVYPYDLAALLESKFNPNLRTIIITTGYMTKSYTSWQWEIKDTWSKLDNINTILVSWPHGDRGYYPQVVANTKVVARQLTVLLYYLAAINGQSLLDARFSEKIYLIGHSLGAHISGFVGKDFDGTVGRITGLDPAGPDFSNVESKFRLHRSDAILVDVIHTNGCSSIKRTCFGIGLNVGHIDYFANDGEHQPACNYDLLACSHKMASSHYISILKHELYMRKLLAQKYHKYYRLLSYRSENYASFRNGSALVRGCPELINNHNDTHSRDLTKCSAPIDFVTPPIEFRAELESTYGIDFDPSIVQTNRFYFYTADQAPYVNDHQLVELRTSRKSNYIPSSSAASTDITSTKCDLHISISTIDGSVVRYGASNYGLIESDGTYEIIVPFLSPSSAAKYELAKLDASDYLLDEKVRDDLFKSLFAILPSKIEIGGFEVKMKQSEARGVTSLSYWLQKLLQTEQPAENLNDESSVCDIEIESVAIQPLRRLHRRLIATYSITARNKKEPEVILQTDNGQVNDEQNPDQERDLSSEPRQSESSLTYYIDSVILGPYDHSIDLVRVFLGEDTANIEHAFLRVESSSIDAQTWLISLVVAAGAFFLISSIIMMKIFRIRRNAAADQLQQLVNNDTSR